MQRTNRPIRVISFIISGLGVILLGLTLYTGGEVNLALPLVFLVISGGFFMLVFYLRPRVGWASYLFIPGAMFAAFGIIFLLNLLTNDWNSWAYAWLLLLAAGGIGMLLAQSDQNWPALVGLIGWGLAVAGISLFAVFGVIAGGLFIQIMAPILLVAAGLLLRSLDLSSILPESFYTRLNASRPQAQAVGAETPAPAALVEPLSTRELEVLRLIDSGLSNQQIADELSIAASTVKTHINNIYGKLEVQTRVQAINRARELRLLGEYSEQ
jgi:DNA-binding CsgD family transcriptional regulator